MNYEALDEALDYIEAVNEGANTDLLKKNSEFKKEYGALYKKLNKAWDSADGEKKYTECKKVFDEMRALVKDYKKFIKELDYETASEKAIGNILGGLYFMSQHLVGAFVAGIGFAGLAASKIIEKKKGIDMSEAKISSIATSIGAGAGQLLKNIGIVAQDINTYRKNFSEDTKKNSSLIKTKLLAYCDKIEDEIVAYERSMEDYKRWGNE